MPYRIGTIVTAYREEDEYTGSGERTCKGYDVDSRDELDTNDICVGFVLKVVPEGIQVNWVKCCKAHQSDRMHYEYHESGELWEIGQLA